SCGRCRRRSTRLSLPTHRSKISSLRRPGRETDLATVPRRVEAPVCRDRARDKLRFGRSRGSKGRRVSDRRGALEEQVLGQKWFYRFRLPSGRETELYITDEV